MSRWSSARKCGDFGGITDLGEPCGIPSIGICRLHRKPMQDRKPANGGKYMLVRAPGHPRAKNNGYVLEHVLLAERALGRHLPEEHPVHHVNEDGTDNHRGNLVICQDHAYHFLLHRRAKALRECGNPSFRLCTFCQRYDDVVHMTGHRATKGGRERSFYHRACRAAHRRAEYRSS